MTRSGRLAVVLLAVGLLGAACSSATSGGAGDASVAAGPRGSATAAPPTGIPATATQPPVTPTPDPPATATPSATPVRPTAEPTLIELAPTPTPTPTPTPIGWIGESCVAPPLATPDPMRPQYEADVTVDPRVGTMTGTMTIAFTPDLPIDEVVLRLWANSPRAAAGGASMSTSDITVEGVAVEVDTADPTTRRIALPSRLAAGETVHVSLAFSLTVPGPARARVARGGGTNPWMRLGSALPLLAWEPGIGWATDPGTTQFAEAVTSPTADYDVIIRTPDDYQVLASGEHDGVNRWTGTAIRDFSFSVGHFAIVERTIRAPDPVLLTMGVDASVPEDPEAYADRIEGAMINFAEIFAPYPWPSLTVALTPGIGGGIEFPTHIMLGNDTIGRTTPHEVAHMLFYSLVGNNQSRDPWMDEGLASYAEFIHEGRDLDAIAYPPNELGNSGQSLPWFEGRSGYYDTVYVQPAVAVASLGPRDRVNCALQIYLAQNAYGLARRTDFFDAIETVFPDAAAALAPYGITR